MVLNTPLVILEPCVDFELLHCSVVYCFEEIFHIALIARYEHFIYWLISILIFQYCFRSLCLLAQ